MPHNLMKECDALSRLQKWKVHGGEVHPSKRFN